MNLTDLLRGTEYKLFVRTGVWHTDGVTLLAGSGSGYATTTGNTAVQPGAPGTPVLTAGDEDVRVSWAAPTDDGGDAVTEYRLGYRPTGGSWKAVAHKDASNTTHTISQLDNGTEYEFRVRARNRVRAGNGWGGWSGTATATPSPDEVTLLDTMMTVGWGTDSDFRPENTGVGGNFGSLDYATFNYGGPNYTLTWLTVSELVTSFIGGDRRQPVTFTKVRVETSPRMLLYHFNALDVTIDGKPLDQYWRRHRFSASRIQDVPEEGLSLSVGDRVSVKISVRPLRAPENLTATRHQNGVELAWDNPNDDRISYYEYRQKAAGGSGWSQWRRIGDGDTTSHVRRVPLGRQYSFQVRAYQWVRDTSGRDIVPVLRRAGWASPIVRGREARKSWTASTA